MTHGSLSNQLIATVKPAQPTIGDGATLVLWTDRLAFTVIDIKKNHIVVSRDGQPPALQKAYLRKDGNYYLGGHLLKIGFRDEYRDPRF